MFTPIKVHCVLNATVSHVVPSYGYDEGKNDMKGNPRWVLSCDKCDSEFPHSDVVASGGSSKAANRSVLEWLEVVLDHELAMQGKSRRWLGKFGTTKPAYETLYGLVVAQITVVRNQVLPDGLGIPSAAQFLLDEVLVGFAGTDPARWGAWYLRKRAYEVGGHFVGRF